MPVLQTRTSWIFICLPFRVYADEQKISLFNSGLNWIKLVSPTMADSLCVLVEIIISRLLFGYIPLPLSSTVRSHMYFDHTQTLIDCFF